MSSVITMKFETPKDFTVDIDNIERVSPRGMELAFAQVEKKFAGMKGVNAKAQREAEARDQVAADKKVEDDLARQSLFDSELASFTREALENAEKKFTALPEEEKEAAAATAAASKEADEKREFLAGMEDRIKALKLADPEISVEEAADLAIAGPENEKAEVEELDSQIDEAEKELEELETAVPETVAEDDGEEVKSDDQSGDPNEPQ